MPDKKTPERDERNLEIVAMRRSVSTMNNALQDSLRVSDALRETVEVLSLRCKLQKEHMLRKNELIEQGERMVECYKNTPDRLHGEVARFETLRNA